MSDLGRVPASASYDDERAEFYTHLHPELGGRTGDPGRMTDEQRRLMDMPLAELEALSKATCQHEDMRVRQWHGFTLMPVLEGRWGIDCPEPKCIRHAEHTGEHEPWVP